MRRKDSNLQPPGYEPGELPSAPPRDINNKFGGGKGIRTPASLTRPLGFQDRSLQPDLGIPPLKLVPETGIEPVRDLTPAGF